MCVLLCLAHPLCSRYALPAVQKTYIGICPETQKQIPAEDIARLMLHNLDSMEVSPFPRSKNRLLAKIRGPLEIFLHFLLTKPSFVYGHFEHLLLSDDHFQLRNKLVLHLVGHSLHIKTGSNNWYRMAFSRQYLEEE